MFSVLIILIFISVILSVFAANNKFFLLTPVLCVASPTNLSFFSQIHRTGVSRFPVEAFLPRVEKPEKLIE